MSGRVRLFLFGTPSGRTIGRKDSRPLSDVCSALVGNLFIHRNQWRRREQVAADLWEDVDRGSALKRLSTVLWRFKNELEIPTSQFDLFVRRDHDHIGLFDCRACWIDVVAFRSRLRVLLANLRQEHLNRRDLMRLERALGHYKGEFLSNLDADWALFERERLRSLYVEGTYRAVSLAKTLGFRDKALLFAREGALIEPLREDFHRELMRLNIESGNRALAIRQYQKCCRILYQELGVAPTPETTEIYDLASRGALPANKKNRDFLPSSSIYTVIDRLEGISRSLEKSSQRLSKFDLKA